MNINQDEIPKNRNQMLDTPWLMYALIALVGFVMTGIVSFGFYTGNRINAVFAPLVDAAMGIRLEATTAHLWFEEILSGDRNEDMQQVWQHLDQTDRYARAMLEGGENPGGTYVSLDDAAMRLKIRKVLEQLTQFRDITRLRLAEKERSGAGSDIDQRYDAIFELFINQAEDVKTRLQQVMARDLRSFQSTQVGLIAACLFLILTVGLAFHRFDRRRAQDFLALSKVNDKLAKQIRERRRAEKMLRSERDKFRGILNAISDGMYITNQDFIIEYQNEIFKNLFGNSIGKRCCAAFGQSEETCNFCHAHESFQSGKISQVEAILSNGRNYDMIFSPFTDQDEEIKTIVLLRDVTEKKKLQAETMRVGHLASLGELAAGVAHEINNPINGIINYAEIMQDQCQENGEDADFPARIVKEGDRIARIVNNLLSFARGRSEEYSPVRVQDILADALGLAKQQIIKDGITLSVDIPPDLPAVRARSQEIQQVFLNILSNARYALNHRFPELHEGKILAIRGDTTTLGGREYVRTIFHDDGTGIPENIIDKISHPFFTTKPRGEGTGLGLSIIHGIIKNHQGKLFFDSVEGSYTIVTVDLPVHE